MCSRKRCICGQTCRIQCWYTRPLVHDPGFVIVIWCCDFLVFKMILIKFMENPVLLLCIKRNFYRFFFCRVGLVDEKLGLRDGYWWNSDRYLLLVWFVSCCFFLIIVLLCKSFMSDEKGVGSDVIRARPKAAKLRHRFAIPNTDFLKFFCRIYSECRRPYGFISFIISITEFYELYIKSQIM